jgi:hypothetical protein
MLAAVFEYAARALALAARARFSVVSVTLDQPHYEGDTRRRLLERVKTRAVGKSDVMLSVRTGYCAAVS